MKLELYHDILAKKIFERASRADKLARQLERLIEDKYSFDAEESTDNLLTKDELGLIHTYLNVDALESKYQSYVKRSEEALEAEQRAELERLAERNKLLESQQKQQRRVLWIVAIAALLLGALLIYALNQTQIAKENENTALGLADSLDTQNELLAEETKQKELFLSNAQALNEELGNTVDQLEFQKAEAERNEANAQYQLRRNIRLQAVRDSIAQANELIQKASVAESLISLAKLKYGEKKYDQAYAISSMSLDFNPTVNNRYEANFYLFRSLAELSNSLEADPLQSFDIMDRSVNDLWLTIDNKLYIESFEKLNEYLESSDKIIKIKPKYELPSKVLQLITTPKTNAVFIVLENGIYSSVGSQPDLLIEESGIRSAAFYPEKDILVLGKENTASVYDLNQKKLLFEIQHEKR
ncbi:MAG: hypothetical protein AAFO07_32065, partial [Bacteroidota bacterium]